MASWNGPGCSKLQLTHLVVAQRFCQSPIVVAGLRWPCSQVLLRWTQTGLAFLAKPVALAPDVEDVAVMEQPVQDR